LARRSLHAEVSLPIQQQIFAGLRQRDRCCYSTGIEVELQALMSKMPTTEEFSSFDAFVTPYWSWEPAEGDLAAHDVRYSAWIDQCTDRLVACHPSAAEQIARLEEMMRLQQRSFIKEGAASHFVLSMCRRNPNFLGAFIEYVGGTPLPALTARV
jgi:hypothetical protein